MLSFRTTVAQSASEIKRLVPVWQRLLAMQPHSVFQRLSWNLLAAEIFRPRLTPLVVCAASENGAVIIPAALNWRTQQIELLGEALFDYRDVLHAGDGELLRLAWHSVAELELPFRFEAVCEEHANSRWRDFPLQDFTRAPAVSGLSEDEFRSRHPRLGRHFRRLQREGVQLEVSTGDNSALVRHLYQCKAERFEGDAQNVFRDLLRREFMTVIAAYEGSHCEIFTLATAGGTLVAGLVSFREEGVRRFYTVYFDPAWARYSPGVVLVFEVTARSLAQGLECDYMTGEYPYKLRLANSSKPLYKVEASAAEMAEIAERPAAQVA